MAKKINLSGVKEFFFNHGEKVALGVFACVALFLGVAGALRAMGAGNAENSSKTLAEEMVRLGQAIEMKVNNGSADPLPEETKKKMEPDSYKWVEIISRHRQSQYAVVPDVPGNKRTNPLALSIRGIDLKDKENPNKYFDMKYIAAPVLTYDYDAATIMTFEGSQAAGGAGGLVGQAIVPMPGIGGSFQGMDGAGAGKLQFVRKGVPQRMVVVTAVFPMKEQVAEFQKALRLMSQQELVPDDLPKPIGFTVIRYKFLPSGDPVNKEGEILVAYTGHKKAPMMSPALSKLLTGAIYDEEFPQSVEAYVWRGLVMPMPKLAAGPYPKFAFPGWDHFSWLDEVKKQQGEGIPGGVIPMPMPPAGGGSKRPIGKGTNIKIPGGFGSKRGPMDMTVPGMADPENGGAAAVPDRKQKTLPFTELKNSDRVLYQRLYGKGPKRFNVYHAMGLFPSPKQAQANKSYGGASMPPQMNGDQTAMMQDRYFSAWNIDSPWQNGGGVGGAAMYPGRFGPPAYKGSARPPRTGQPNPMPIAPMGEDNVTGQPIAPTTWERDAIVRFIDPEVEPGYTYRYGIQVILENPNFGKNKDVAFQRLATIPEIASKIEYTPAITVPGEYHLYAVDQDLLDSWTGPKLDEKKKPKAIDPRTLKDVTTFQIHKWVTKEFNPRLGKDLVIGDWAIAERVMTRKGSHIGQRQDGEYSVPVLVPVWDKGKDDFFLPREMDGPKKTKRGKKESDKQPGFMIPLNRTLPKNPKKEQLDRPETEEAPVLVDFTGGKRFRGATGGVVEEESAVDALIMSADGKLSVLNSRVDSDPNNPVAAERNQRLLNVRRRAERYLIAPAAATPPNGQKGGPNIVIPGGNNNNN